MKSFDTYTSEATTTGALDSGAFTIKANGKAFRTLIDGLYSDKERAVVRELWSNAFDSHVDAGKVDTKFDCHLPNVWEPHFSVRDYGVSLSHEDVMKLYTTVFESTKEDSNDVVGKLGLGSKSPFAYTDTFTVTARLDGEKRVYSALIGTDGIPTINLLHRENTDEDQGLEISFPVKEDDFRIFRRAAERVMAGFTHIPNVTGTDDFFISTPETLSEGNGWWWNSEGDGGARQGCVIYPFNEYSLPDLSDAARALTRVPLIVDFPIGSVDITASRESLSYDEVTTKNITTRLEEVVADIVATHKVILESASSRWEASILLQTKTGLADLPDALFEAVLDASLVKGEKPKSYLHVTIPHLAMQVMDRYEFGRRKTVRWHSGWIKNRLIANTGSNHKTVFILEELLATDAVKRVPARIRHFWEDTVCLHKGYDGPNETRVVWVRGTKESFAHLKGFLGEHEALVWMDVADMDLPPKKERLGVSSSSVPFRHFSGVVSHYSASFDAVSEIPQTGDWYVDLHRGDAQKSDGTYLSLNHLQKAIRILKDAGVMPSEAPVWGIPGTYRTVPAKLNLINVMDAAKEYALKEYDEDGFVEYLAHRDTLSEVGYKPLYDFWKEHQTGSFEGCESAENIFNVYAKLTSSCVNKSKVDIIGRFVYETEDGVASSVDEKMLKRQDELLVSLRDEIVTMKKSYPLLKSIDRNMYNINQENALALANYMGALDLARNTVPSFAA